MSDGIRISDSMIFPVEAVTETFGFLAMRGGGKSNAVVVMAEEMYRLGLPWVAVDPKGDWWGIRSNLAGNGPGLPIPIFGGLHGDLPLEPEAGVFIADLICRENLTCVLDVSEFESKAKQVRFLTDFATRLYRNHGHHPQPRHIFAEEADDYIPQRVMADMAKCVGAWENIIKRGRSRGLGCSIVTQRSASINKDALSQVLTLVAMRTTGPQDRKAIMGWVEYHSAARELVDALPELPSGDAWVFSPQWLGKTERVTFRRRSTFDSGGTPTVGSDRPVATLADIDLGSLGAELEAIVERAAMDDPKALKRRIAELERELKAATETRETLTVEVPRPFVPDSIVQAISDLFAAVKGAQVAHPTPTDGTAWLAGPPLPKMEDVPKFETTVAFSNSKRTTDAAGNRIQHDDDDPLGKGERKVLSVLANYPDGRTHSQLAFLAGYSAKASTLGVILSKLRKLQLVAPNAPPRLTPHGLLLADPEPLPTGAELLDHWRYHERMGEGERKVLDVLVSSYPRALDHDEICSLTGYSPSASTMGVILSKLRKLGLVEKGARRLDLDFAQSVGL